MLEYGVSTLSGTGIAEQRWTGRGKCKACEMECQTVGQFKAAF